MTKSCDEAPQPGRGLGDVTCPPEALSIVKRLREAGHQALFVGGCVRDALMGIPPKDWDIATSASPDLVESLFPRTVAVGKAFGVILVVTPDGEFEVATFRGDREYSDGRRPSGVYFTSVGEDVKRRDFTINALLYDPVADEVIDYVGGRADLEARVIRTVGDPAERFGEDYLRLLRAVRFAARTGFRIEESTYSAVVRLHSLVSGLAAERVGEELVRMLTEGHSERAFRLLARTGLLADVLPEVAALRGVPQPPEYHPEGDVWEHVLVMLAELDTVVKASRVAPPQSGHLLDEQLVFPLQAEREVLAWAVLLHDIGKPETLRYADRIRFHGHDAAGAEMAVQVLTRLRRPGRICRAVEELVRGHMRFIHIEDMRVAKRRRFVQDELFPLHLALHRIDCLGSHRDLSGYDFALAAWQEELSRPAARRPLVGGSDLIAAGYRPGPQMGRMLRAVDDARLEGHISTQQEAMDWIRQHFPVERP
jgi:poly(A) polymerase